MALTPLPHTPHMPPRLNAYDQPIGPALPDWQPCPRPDGDLLLGTYTRLEAVLADRHGDDLFAAYQMAPDDRDWTYLPAERPATREAFDHYLQRLEASHDPLHYAVVDNATGRALGTLALMRIEPGHGTVECGAVVFSPALQRSRIATEAHFLMMQYVFDTLGYRRYEWKCDTLNARSRRAAQRLGFQFEGIFRQVVVYKGRSRDTAWFSMLDHEWPAISAGFTRWLAPENFDAQGQQRSALVTRANPDA